MTRRNEHKTAKPRITRIGVVLFYLALATAIAWLAAARWSGTPALNQTIYVPGWIPGPPIDPDRDRTKELVAAVSKMPPLPPYSLPPPPEGMRWALEPRPTRLSISDGLYGAWTPETRPHLQAVIEHISSPEVEHALTQLANLSRGGWRPFGPDGTGNTGLSSARRSIKTLITRARYNHEEKGDVGAALTDIESAYKLSGIVYDSGDLTGVVTAMACDSLTHSELTQLARERTLSPEHAARALSVIRDFTFERDEIWQWVIDPRVDGLLWQLDTTYTDDGHGDGWLVLSYLDYANAPWWAATPRCGAWNVFSPLFNSRRTIARKIAHLRTSLESVPTVPFREARASLRAAESRTIFGVADGSLAMGSSWTNLFRVHELLAQVIARRRVHPI